MLVEVAEEVEEAEEEAAAEEEAGTDEEAVEEAAGEDEGATEGDDTPAAALCLTSADAESAPELTRTLTAPMSALASEGLVC